MNAARNWRALLFLVPLSLVLMGSTCSTAQKQASLPPGAWRTQAVVADANGNPATSFAAGEQIHFVLSLKNTSNQAQTIGLNWPYRVNFVLVAKGATHIDFDYDTDADVAWPALAGVDSENFAPGQVREFDETWDQLAAGGQAIAPGTYEVQARVVSPDDTAAYDDLRASPYRSELVEFTIQP